MPRALVVANGRTFLAWDDAYRLVEATWPGVGPRNHLLGRPCRIGLHSGRSFAWSDEMDVELGYAPGSTATRARLESARLGLALTVEDALHRDEDLLVRSFRVRNLRRVRRRVRLFLHHDLTLDGSDVGDTVLADPQTGGLLHYKEDVVALVGAERVAARACGVKGFRGLEGTWRDAEDGKLSGNPVAHGSVDSVLAVDLDVAPGGSARTRAWLGFAADFPGAWRLDALARAEPETPARLAREAFAGAAGAAPPRGLPPGAAALYARSLAVVRALLDAGGGVLAAVDSDILSFNRDTYAYVWPRDGAFVAHALDLAGEHDASDAFFDYLAECPTWDGALMHKYTVRRRIASTWHAWDAEDGLPLQEDETGLALWALERHVRATGASPKERFDALVRPLADFLVAYRDEAGVPLMSWDLWEERMGVHLFTAAATVAGLRAAARLARDAGEGRSAARWAKAAEETSEAVLEALWMPEHGRFARRIAPSGDADPTPDASMAALVLFGLLPPDDPRARATLDPVFRALEAPGRIGGTARYVGDPYHRKVARGPGNPWIVTTLWRGLWEAAKGERAGLARALRWSVARASPAGHLAEQFHPTTGAPLSVSPLTWSHAAFVQATQAYLPGPTPGRWSLVEGQ